jgi:hypothetical protein
VFHKKKLESENSSGEELSVYENCLTRCINYYSYQDVLIKADDLEGLCNWCCVREHDKGTHTLGRKTLKCQVTQKTWTKMTGSWRNGVAVPWLKRLVAGPSPRRPGFAPTSVLVRFVVDKVVLGEAFLRILWFSSVNSIPPWLSILLYHLGDEH